MTWNVEKINNIFLPYERGLILSMPLSFKRPKDRQVWFFNTHGRYKVQSGCRLIQAASLNNVVGCLNGNRLGLWKKIWQLNIPRKIILFVWKTINGILLTREAIIQSKVNVEGNCPNWENELELNTIVCVVAHWLGQTVKWSLPRVCKMNVDAALVRLDDEKKMGASFVVRDESGQLILAGASKLNFRTSAEEAELVAVVWSLQCCKREGLTIPELELDSLMVVNWIKEKKVTGVFGNTVRDFFDLMRQVGCEYVQYCPRVCNNVAHLVAKRVKEMAEEAMAWRRIEDMYSNIQHAMLRDIRSSN
ncbi:Uncharacterized protein TCM_044833 [Theobroma cacao]|uniref:RNase H type-1 domain-containing protein n=1 Tax=Theobroma cacao TaxID=3641 RepID=A0A061FRK4_THECC|nr:Uncharacterized protein TCM_044833 [Theobroma cacao]